MPYQTPGFPTSSRLITVSVPDTLEMYFWGALSELVFPWNWEAWGNMTPDEAAAAASPLVEEIDLTDNFAVIPPDGVAGQLLSKNNDIDNSLAWVSQTLSPPGGIAYVDNLAAGKAYTYWIDPLEAYPDMHYALTNGVIKLGLPGLEEGAGFSMGSGYIVVVFDFVTPTRMVRYAVYGDQYTDEDFIIPQGVILYYSDDNTTFVEVRNDPYSYPASGVALYRIGGDISFSVGPHRYWLVAPFSNQTTMKIFLTEIELYGIKAIS